MLIFFFKSQFCTETFSSHFFLPDDKRHLSTQTSGGLLPRPSGDLASNLRNDLPAEQTLGRLLVSTETLQTHQSPAKLAYRLQLEI